MFQSWHYYDVASAFDAMNRRVYKSFYDETTLKTAQWYFYYDALNRLSEVRYTPDTSSPSTYTVFQLFWIGTRLTLYWQTDYPSATTSKRYTATDETDRVYLLLNWPASGNPTAYWEVNPSAWGVDTFIDYGVGVMYQPMLFAGQYRDSEASSWTNSGSVVHRDGVVLNGFRSYDPFTGSYLQIDPRVAKTWSTYIYAGSSPVMFSDPDGLEGKIEYDTNGNKYFCYDGANETITIELDDGTVVTTTGFSNTCFMLPVLGDWDYNGVDPTPPPPGPIGPGGTGGGSGSGTTPNDWKQALLDAAKNATANATGTPPRPGWQRDHMTNWDFMGCEDRHHACRERCFATHPQGTPAASGLDKCLKDICLKQFLGCQDAQFPY